ncbi:unnamed protein product [Owenia fusiformis]|uniref:Uncharacterized protein n=1 Tax=Owenia fusiformis TaxID=6347 RepID=A0A8J1UCN9_OWEFU|nr:unnamed protein product [Owenia fusiformis]
MYLYGYLYLFREILHSTDLLIKVKNVPKCTYKDNFNRRTIRQIAIYPMLVILFTLNVRVVKSRGDTIMRRAAVTAFFVATIFHVCTKDKAVGKVNYIKEYKVIDYFNLLNVFSIERHIERIEKLVDYYITNTPLTSADKLILKGSMRRMKNVEKRLHMFSPHMKEYIRMKRGVVNMLRNVSVGFLNGTNESFKNAYHRLELTLGDPSYVQLRLNNPFTISRIPTTSKREMKKVFKLLLLMKNNQEPATKEIKEIKANIEIFYEYLKIFTEEAKIIWKHIQLLKIPDNDGTFNCNRDSKGVNIIQAEDGMGFLAVCDSEWLVVAQRFDGSVDFPSFNFTFEYRANPLNYDPDYISDNLYGEGFGDPPSEYFIGLNNLYAVAKQAMYEIRFELTTWEGETRYAYYSLFDVAYDDSYGIYGEGPIYKLRLGHYRGTAGDFKNYYDYSSFSDCYWMRHRFWWFGDWVDEYHENVYELKNCGKANLFGRYNNGPRCDVEMECMTWPAWPNDLLEYPYNDNRYYSFKKMRIMIRRVIDPCIEIKENTELRNDMIGECEGAWLVVAHKINGSVHFNRTVNEYINGFGSISGEFFTGLRPLNKLTKRFKWYGVRFEATTINGKLRYAEYSAIDISNSYTDDFYHVDVFGVGDRRHSLDCSNRWFLSIFATWDRETNCTKKEFDWYCGCMLQTSPGLFDKKDSIT